ncbi:MAG TPA: hypothetical protein VHB01_11160 [Nitrosospira sp.]|jgi:hypothetical protein|nr:hypothetical protein [Nitrosospira sp.]
MLRTIVSLFGAPAAWVAQMSLSEPLAAYGCYPHEAPLPAPLWAGLPVILIAISLACLAAGLVSGYVARSLWKQAGTRPAVATGSGSSFDGGQGRFLAMLGQLSSFVFIIAILFTSCAVILVSPCSPWV